MRLFDFFLAENRLSLRRVGMMAAVAGATNAMMLAIVNSAAKHANNGGPQLGSVVLFLVVILVYSYSQYHVLETCSAEIERLIHRCRERLIDRIKQCELREIEHIGRGSLFAAIGADTRTISQASDTLVLGAQAVIVLVCACAYLATVSMTSLVVSALVLTLSGRIYLRKMEDVQAALREGDDEENQLHDIISGLLDGFKEVKLSSARARDLIVDFVRVSERTSHYRIRAKRSLAASFVFSQFSFMVVLGSLVFVTPMFGSSYSGTVMESMTTVLFLLGPLSGLIVAVPQMAIAETAAGNIRKLEIVLDSNIVERIAAVPTPERKSPPPAIKTLELRRVFFSHVSDDSHFDVGPVNLTIHAGETVFITGGNGSGKSTLIRLMIGLYPPVSGEVLANGIPVVTGNAQAFRDRFCAVFSDFHLFRKLYGIAPPSPEAANALLEEMEIANKTGIVDGGFTNIDLSSGQRKRLALIAALLEDKPIIVLDEWAADQDPHFRRKFYDDLLPGLKAAGKTIIAVTHDDRYFYTADRRFHMEEGQLQDLTESLRHG